MVAILKRSITMTHDTKKKQQKKEQPKKKEEMMKTQYMLEANRR